MLLFDNIITFCDEGGYVKLKQTLKSFIDNFATIINVINLILKNKKSEYFIAIKKTKTQISKNCFIDALKNLRVFVSLYALKLICKQDNKFISVLYSESFLFCT